MSASVKHRCKEVRSQHGFTLFETLIGVSLICLSIMLSVQLSSNLAQVSRKGQSTLEFEKSMATINSFASSEQSCRLSLGGPMLYGGAADANAQTLNLGGVTNIRFYYPVDGGGARPVFLDPNPAAGATTYGSWTITSIQARPFSTFDAVPSPAPPGPAQFPVRISLRMQRTGMSGNETFSRISANANLTVVTDSANRVVSCTGLTFGTGTGTVPQNTSFPICNADSALYSDGTRLSCRRVRCSGATPTPLGGWDIYGNILCGP